MTERAWSILTKSMGGTVSVIRDLTLEECRQTYERLDPWYGIVSTRYEPENISGISWGGGGSFRNCCDGDIEIREVFGPPNWDRSEMNTWEHWPKSVVIKKDDPRWAQEISRREAMVTAPKKVPLRSWW